MWLPLPPPPPGDPALNPESLDPVEPRLLSRLQGTLDDRRIETAGVIVASDAPPDVIVLLDRGIVMDVDTAAAVTAVEARPVDSKFSVE